LSEVQAPAPYAVDAGSVARDREALLGIWRGRLGVDARMQSKFEWFYQECPFGEPTVCVLRHGPDRQAVGAASAGPRRLLANGTGMLAGVLVDLAVTAEHRSLGPALMLQTALAESAGRRFGLLYGFPNPKAAPVFKRIGYSRLGEIVRLARVLRHRAYLARRFPRALAALGGPVTDLAVRIRDAWRSRADTRWQPCWSAVADARFDELWSRTTAATATLAIRDATFARWRFDRCPFEQTRYLLLSHPVDGFLQAWFACQAHDTTLHVRDCWSVDGESGVRREFVDALLAAARRDGHAAVSFEIAGAKDRVGGWKSAGFQERGRRPVFGKWTDGRPSGSVDLYLTSADEDE